MCLTVIKSHNQKGSSDVCSKGTSGWQSFQDKISDLKILDSSSSWPSYSNVLKYFVSFDNPRSVHFARVELKSGPASPQHTALVAVH
jgi:peptide methionine sulfoxide reductase MsrB